MAIQSSNHRAVISFHTHAEIGFIPDDPEAIMRLSFVKIRIKGNSSVLHRKSSGHVPRNVILPVCFNTYIRTHRFSLSLIMCILRASTARNSAFAIGGTHRYILRVQIVTREIEKCLYIYMRRLAAETWSVEGKGGSQTVLFYGY